MFTHRITVFTPTYNRAHTLERLYQSLQQQIFIDFEWLVIDDGSTDRTPVLFEKWTAEENPFPIHYHFKENGGKHTAINFGLDQAQGELFFTADSDDFLTNDALQKVNRWAASLPANEKFCGVVGNLGNSPDETPNTIFKREWRDATLLERYPEVSVTPLDGERAFIFFTEIHKRYRYPEFENEKFITEAVAWNRMAHNGFKMRVFNDIIYIYKFLPNGLTSSGSKIFIDNSKGYGLWLKEKAQFCKYSTRMKLKMYYSYFSSQKSRLSTTEIATNIGASYLVISLMSILYSLKNCYNRFR
ncbi:glycosyltransferase family 2 protein [Chryseobacterium sp. MDT2-18]|uniref:glycosyltransferase family 2 protein n=1 Tax=Chryseobacterium sp. MDT2-18 TaxID=1259136 RepID=UPI00277DCB1C|nr:glycosyltransferase family 2 protein [Chryseobacterium sp. MDT2-18]MDQ0478170.1 glycosyltransferase involved in cell wall biosynthesis [Chryseobacterium sp. MDT2-18]